MLEINEYSKTHQQMFVHTQYVYHRLCPYMDKMVVDFGNHHLFCTGFQRQDRTANDWSKELLCMSQDSQL